MTETTALLEVLDLPPVASLIGELLEDPRGRRVGRIRDRSDLDRLPADRPLLVVPALYDLSRRQLLLVTVEPATRRQELTVGRSCIVEWVALPVPAGSCGDTIEVAAAAAVAATTLTAASEVAYRHLDDVPGRDDLLADAEAVIRADVVDLDVVAALVALAADARAELAALHAELHATLYPCPVFDASRELAPTTPALTKTHESAAALSRTVRSYLRRAGVDAQVSTVDGLLRGDKVCRVEWTDGLSLWQMDWLLAGLTFSDPRRYRSRVETRREVSARHRLAAAVAFHSDHGRPADTDVPEDGVRIDAYLAASDQLVDAHGPQGRLLDAAVAVTAVCRADQDEDGYRQHLAMIDHLAGLDAPPPTLLATYRTLLDDGLTVDDAFHAAVALS